MLLTRPAIPALLVLFGWVFCFAAFHIAGIAWNSLVTQGFYGMLLIWGLSLLPVQGASLRPWQTMDGLFLIFVVLVVGSLALWNKEPSYYAKFIPFFVLLPYLLGRLTQKSDFRIFVHALPWLACLLLVLCAVDFWLVTGKENIYDRIRFFGIDHSPLLVAQPISASALVLAFSLLSSSGSSGNSFWKRAVLWFAFGIAAAVLVLIAARGMLLLSAASIVFMACLLRGSKARKFLLLGYLAFVVWGTYALVPKPVAQLYERLLATNLQAGPAGSGGAVNAEDSRRTEPRCKPLVDGINSASIRLVLYGEAMDLTIKHPLAGIGAGNFGNHSCAGPRSYPHSTILQAFAEMGIVGGGVFFLLLAVGTANFIRALYSGKISREESAFWFSLFVFFVLTDQIYGNYFVAAGTLFMLGTSAKLALRSCSSVGDSEVVPKVLPKISVITPSYNQAEFLERTIRSVLDQNYPNLEYIVIDGGSTDGSVEIIKKYADRIDYWVSERDAGQTDAINKGFKRATGEWIGWQNSDDVYYPGSLLSVAQAAGNHPDADLIIANVNLIDSADGLIRDMRYVRPSYLALLAEGMVMTNQAAFWRRRVHSEIGWLNQALHFAFDYDWFLRLTKNRYGVHVSEFWGGYRFHGETKTSLHANRFREENREILKGHPSISSLTRQIYKLRRLALHLVNGDFRYFVRGLRSRITGQHSVPF